MLNIGLNDFAYEAEGGGERKPKAKAKPAAKRKGEAKQKRKHSEMDESGDPAKGSPEVVTRAKKAKENPCRK